MLDRDALLNALVWQLEAGVDEAILDAPLDRLIVRAPKPAAAAPLSAPRAPPAAPPQLVAQSAALGSARSLAAAAPTLEALRAAVEQFEGCALKATATRTVFADGVPTARVMFIGEAPGAEEDRLGKPFVGASGQFLDRMIGWIGLARAENAYISNIVFWRPPGNREPSSDEVALCLPFVERHIELVRPAALVLLGGPSAKTLLNRAEGITRLRGRWYDYRTRGMGERGEAPIPALATFHPAFLLRSPARKRDAWRDMLALKESLAQSNAIR